MARLTLTRDTASQLSLEARIQHVWTGRMDGASGEESSAPLQVSHRPRVEAEEREAVPLPHSAVQDPLHATHTIASPFI